MKAVIFDMDGVLIDSEHLWRKAMIRAFAAHDMLLSEDDCRSTMGMRIEQVIALWLGRFKRDPQLADAIQQQILDLLTGYLETEGKPLPGVSDILAFCRQKDIPRGLATSSSRKLMHTVLKKLDMETEFVAAVSAETMANAKPHPEVFLACAQQMNIEPGDCVVIEDSLNGVIAARAAGMKVIAVPDADHLKSDERRARQFVLADYQAADMKGALHVIRALFHNDAASVPSNN